MKPTGRSEKQSSSGRGGKRRGAGRKPNGDRPGVPHEPRAEFSSNMPLIVTVRVLHSVPYLRSPKALKIIRDCIYAARERLGMRLTQFSVQGNHIHLIVEAKDRAALSRAMKGFSVRIARRLNRAYGRKGKVFADRFHSRVLRGPWDAVNAIRYVKDNSAIHAERRGKPWKHTLDPFAGGPCPRRFFDFCRALVAKPRSYLLRTAWELLPWRPQEAAPASRPFTLVGGKGPRLAREAPPPYRLHLRAA